MRLLAIVVLVIIPAAAAAQVPGGDQPRDRVVPRETGTAAVRGRVIDGVSGEPVARARVRLVVRGAVSQATVLTEITNRDGAFSFSSLPSGSANLAANKVGYLPATYPDHGRGSIRQALRTLKLTAGASIDDVVVKIDRGSAISGRVVDAHGDPVEFASVSVLRLMPGGQPEMRGSSPTNDLGEFRVARLEPGTYVLSVYPTRSGHDSAVTSGEPLPQPIPTYYPSALSPEQAQAITLGVGESPNGLEVVLAEGTPTTVTGTVVRRDGQPVAQGFINAVSVGRSLFGMDGGGGGSSVRPDGTFRLVLNPGEYLLQAHLPARSTDGSPSPGSEESGMLRLVVGASPIESVILVAGPGATASGRVVFEGASPPPPVPPAPLHLPLSSPDGGCRSGMIRVSADWTFRVDGLIGTCSKPAHAVFGRWTLKAVTRAGDDFLDRPITFEAGQHIDGLQVVFTDRRSALTFVVTDERGHVTEEYVTLVFPSDKGRWVQHSMPVQTFYVPPGEVRRDRQLTVQPGEYFVIAVDDIAHEDTRAPATLERLALSATRVTVSEGAKVEVALRRLELRDVVR